MNAEIAKLQSDFVQFSPLLPELNDIVIEFVRLLYEGRYTWKDILDISPNITYTFLLDMKIHAIEPNYNEPDIIIYNGDVYVKRMNDTFKFYFKMFGTHCEYSTCKTPVRGKMYAACYKAVIYF